MKDPYQTLGIQRGASDEEIKKAYRAQCKRWHPDLNPNDATAEERFKDIQAAYDAITKGEPANPFANGNPYTQNSYTRTGYQQQGNPYARQQGYRADDPFSFHFGGFDFGDMGGFGQQQAHASYSEKDSTELQAARNYLINGRYAEARHVLDSVANRNARWYYLSALAYNGLGRSINALQDARLATQMDPTNPDYRTLLARLQNSGQTYRRQSTPYRTQGSSVTGWCFQLILLNLLCNCCGGGCRLPFFGRGFFY